MDEFVVDPAALKLDFLPDDLQGVYLVGGTVRDLLMGRAPADIDLAVAGDIERTARRIAEKTRGTVVDLGKDAFAVLRVAASALTVDITPLAGDTIETDLRQRDFTVNAMAYDLAGRRLVDCTGGRADLQRKTIRMVSPTAFEKDPARLVRAYRMAAALRFAIAADTRAAVGDCAHLVGRVAGERIWAELLKLFAAADAAPILKTMAADGLLTAVFPELQATVGCTQNRHHQFDVFTHSLLVVETLEELLATADRRFAGRAAPADLAALPGHAAILKYAALLHDVGKPETRRVGVHGRVGFPGHAGRSAALAAAIGERLRLSRRQRDVADAVIRHHIRPLFLFLADGNGTLGRRGMVRFFIHGGDLTLPVIVHSMADIAAKNATPQPRDAAFLAFCDRLIAAHGEYCDRKLAGPPLIDGRDLMHVFGLSPSPQLGEILRRVDERRLAGELTTRDEALAWVADYLGR